MRVPLFDQPAVAEARNKGAEFTSGGNQWRAGKGSIVTDWCNTQADAARAYLALHAKAPSVWVAITSDDQSQELDCSLHTSEDDAKCAVMTELHELYGHIFNDDPPPDEYDVEQITSWLADNNVRFTWSIRAKQLP